MKIRKPSTYGFDRDLAQYRVTYNGCPYSLRVLEYVDDEFDLAFVKAPLRVNGIYSFVFKAKCWWVEGGSWFVGAKYPDDREKWGDLLGPFDNPDQAHIYLKLTVDA